MCIHYAPPYRNPSTFSGRLDPPGTYISQCLPSPSLKGWQWIDTFHRQCPGCPESPSISRARFGVLSIFLISSYFLPWRILVKDHLPSHPVVCLFVWIWGFVWFCLGNFKDVTSFDHQVPVSPIPVSPIPSGPPLPAPRNLQDCRTVTIKMFLWRFLGPKH